MKIERKWEENIKWWEWGSSLEIEIEVSGIVGGKLQVAWVVGWNLQRSYKK